MMKKENKARKILWMCIAVSLSLHVISLFLLSHYRWYNSVYHEGQFPLRASGSSEQVLAEKKYEIPLDIKESYPSQEEDYAAVPIKEKEELIWDNYVLDNLALSQEEDTITFFIARDETIQNWQELEKNFLTIQKEKADNLVHEIKKAWQNLPLHEKGDDLSAKAEPREEKSFVKVMSPLQAMKEKSGSAFTLSFQDHLKYNPLLILSENRIAPLQNIAFSSVPFPSLEKLQTASLKDLFDVQLSYCRESQDGEYLFALTLIPKQPSSLKQMQQNFLFLVDKSSSITKPRFETMRHSVASSFNQMISSNKFNIISFAHNMQIMADVFCKSSQQFFKMGKRFLVEQQPATFFSTTEIVPVLKYIRSSRVSSSELYTIILLTDGEWLNRQKNYRLLEQWTRTNPDNISFYALAVKGDKNLPLLEFFTQRNKGSLITATTSKAMKRHLMKLVRSLQMPIAKNISLHSVPLDNQETVSLWSTSGDKANLYANEPFVILGRCKSLADFDLFIQGKNNNQWFNIKKRVSFSEALETKDRSLSKLWIRKLAYECYEKYFLEEDPKYIDQANALLKSFHKEKALR